MDENTFKKKIGQRENLKVDFSCDLLLQTFQKAIDNLKEKCDVNGNLFDEALSLFDDVLRLHRYERLMIRHELVLQKELFRAYYAAFPGKPQDTFDSSFLESIYKCNYWEYKAGNGKRENPNKISVIISLRDSFELANRALIQLIYDLSNIYNFQKEIHICVDRTKDDTIRRCFYIADTFSKTRDISFHIYVLDETIERSNSKYGADVFGKPFALQIVAKKIKENSKKSGNAPNHYLYIADDDIIFVDLEDNSGNSTIKKLLDRLVDGTKKIPQIVSGTYCTFEKQLGFGELPGVRKLQKYYENKGNKFLLPNLYGGCMACHLDSFPRYIPGYDYGLDSFLTIMVLKDWLLNSARQKPKFTDFCYADTSILVGHPEPQQVITAVKRLIRDEEFREKGIKDLLNTYKETTSVNKNENITFINQNFLGLRTSVFNNITETIEQTGSIRHQICQTWYKEIRKRTKNKDRTIENMSQLHAVNWKHHKSDHEICSDLVNNDTKFANLVESLIRHCPIGDYWVARLRDSNISKEGRLQMAAFLAYRGAHHLSQSDLLRDPYLFHFIRISFLYIGIIHKLELFSSRHRYLSLLPNNGNTDHKIEGEGETLDCFKFSRGFLPFNLNDPLGIGQSAGKTKYSTIAVIKVVNKALESVGKKSLSEKVSLKPIDADRSIACFVTENGAEKGRKTRNDEFFVRYYPVIGASRFAPISPRRQIYLQILGENVFSAILGKDHVIQSIYPSLTRAFLSYLGPGKRHPHEIVFNSLLIQESIRKRNETLLSFIWFKEPNKVLAAYAELLATLHGRTLGVFKRREPKKWKGLANQPKALLKMLWEHQDQLRLFSADVYNQWIGTRGNFASRIHKLLGSDIEDGNLFSNVKKVVHSNGYLLTNLWNSLSEDSTEFYKKAAAIGHLYLSFDNILVGTDHIDVKKMQEGMHEFDETDHRLSPIEPSRKAYNFKYKDAELKKSAKLKLYRFDWVFFIDPAYELGKSLAYVFRHFLDQLRVLRDHPRDFPTDLIKGDLFHWLVSLRQQFQDKYKDKLGEIILSQNKKTSESWTVVNWKELGCNSDGDLSAMVSQLVFRGLRYAGFRLLDDFAGSREFDHTFEVREALEKIIIDLLQFGLKMTIHYPDGAV